MAFEQSTSQSNGIAFLVSAGIVYGIVAAACSSPQTTEINADQRAETLMKWVHIGLGQSALFIGAAAYFDPPHRSAILMGGGLAAVIMYASYWHAKDAGMKSTDAGTEDSGNADKTLNLKTALSYQAAH